MAETSQQQTQNEQLQGDWTCANVFYLLTSLLVPQTFRLMLLMIFASFVTVGKILKGLNIASITGT